MPIYKNVQRNTWFASFYFTDWNGKRKKKKKEGFLTKKEAIDFEHNFRQAVSSQCNIQFANLVEIYLNDCQYKLKSTTCHTKATVIRKYLLPDFADIPINKITANTIRNWQNKMLSTFEYKTNRYLRYINAQFSCIFNFAMKYYNLPQNPVKQCGNIGNNKDKEISFWTLSEFQTFAKTLQNQDELYTIFNLLFWTGIRRGELLALRPMDFNFKEKTFVIKRNKVFINSKGFISDPKTKTSMRTVSMPKFLADLVANYIQKHKILAEQLLFEVSPMYLSRRLKTYCQKINLKPIRIHDFRHSHASLLIEQGISPLIIAERLGHKDINTTLKIYTHLYPHKQQYLAKSLDNLYKQAIKQ